ncbi:MAG: ferrous iron transport protein B [Gemmataceae bacterium]
MTSTSNKAEPSPSSRRLVVALVGNPNTGKTTLFNALSGLNHRVGNYPGVTVESKKGQMTCDGLPFEIIDLPGTYSLAPRSPDEMVAVDVILGQQAGEARPDVLVCIADASNLERNLYLTTQAMELGVPVVLALNMIDVAESQGLRLDVPLLAQRLGVPVVAIQAHRRIGLDGLRREIARAVTASLPSHHPAFPAAFEAEVALLRQHLGSKVATFLISRLILDLDGYTEKRLAPLLPSGVLLGQVRERLAAAGHPVAALEARTRYGWIRENLKDCVQRPAIRPVRWTDRIDRVLTHRIWGTLLFLVVMFLVFQSIFTGSRPLMKLIDEGKEWLTDVVREAMPPGPFSSLLIEGVIGGVGSVVVFLPQILILFAFIAVLEDCGYMARAAFLMDRLMARAGLSGKSFIPLLSSLACAVPGILATRVIEDRRDRFATILVAPLMSCSARLPIYILLIGAFLTQGFPFWVPGMVMFALYALGLVLAPLMSWVLKRTLLRGRTPVFVLEMPAYKVPSLRGILRRVFDSGWLFLSRAGTVILACMVLVWILLNFPAGDFPERVAALEAQGQDGAQELARVQMEWKRQGILGRLGRLMEPVVRPLGWDWRVGVAALASFPAREVVVSTLGILFQQGEVSAEDVREAGSPGIIETGLGKALRDARWEEEPSRPLFTVPMALSLMVFFALCCQCASTLAVIRRETQSWLWPVFTFVYMTLLAYVGALLTYQIGTLCF